MRMKLNDFFWITPLGLASLIFLNIFIQGGSYSPRIADKKPIPSQNLSKGGNLLSRKGQLSEPVIAEKTIKPYLPFKLLGTITGKYGLAFIYNPDTNKQGIYRLNDFIGDYKITNIVSGKVMLEKNGSKHELRLTGDNNKRIVNNETGVSVYSDGTVVVDKLKIMSQISKVNELLTKIKISPVPDSSPNKLMGYRIDNVPSGSIIEAAGIKSGDVIHAIQGKNIENINVAWKMFDEVKKLPRFEVVVLRNGAPLTLRYEVSN